VGRGFDEIKGVPEIIIYDFLLIIDCMSLLLEFTYLINRFKLISYMSFELCLHRICCKNKFIYFSIVKTLTVLLKIFQ